VSEPAQLSFPALSAITQRFTLGVPTQLTVSADGSRVLFVRARSGTDREGLLWCLDVATGEQRVLLDPTEVLHGETEHIPAQELARRERLRQGGAGVTAFAVDEQADQAVTALSGRVFVVAVEDGAWREIGTRQHAVDPRLSPDGRWVAFHADRALHLVPTDPFGGTRTLAVDDDPAVSWGLADFAHAEELDRNRAFWWAPDSSGLLVTRVDESPVQVWHIADPAHPDRPPATVRYPAAGTANAETSLWFVPLDGDRSEVPWDHSAWPYLATVGWAGGEPALLGLLSRDQRDALVLRWSPGSEPAQVRLLHDDAFLDVLPGVPAWWDGRLLTVEVDAQADCYRLCADGEPLTPPGLQVRGVLAVQPEHVLLLVAEDERERRVLRLGRQGDLSFLTPSQTLAYGWAEGSTSVVRVDGPDSTLPTVTVHHGSGEQAQIDVLAVEAPGVPRPQQLARPRPDDPRVAVLEPLAGVGSEPLPVLLDPYGGPHGQEVLADARSWTESQWWAEQGYLVVVAEGPGTPGSPAWERAMAGRFADPAVAAQVRALQMVADRYGAQADLSRVAVRGWSFGGYLAARLVLEQPDLVHAAVAGAPVTDFSLYDTAYTERYLGLPAEQPHRYEHESLLGRAPSLRRPLMIIHGFSDDNVVVAHSLRLSQALLEAGRAHQVLPLSGVTHMTPQAVVAENLLLAQRDFLAEALRRPPS
jgi:dipeptidyl-peptidase-4